MRRQCDEPGCDRPAFGRGLCSKHYQKARYQNRLPESPPQRHCAHCRESFKSRKWNAFYCSKACNDAARRARIASRRPTQDRACLHCGSSLAGRRPNVRFCTLQCGQGWRNARIALAADARRKQSRRPCRGCEGGIPDHRRGNAKYCGAECKKRSVRQRTYGLTRAELELLLAQHEHCAICGGDEWGKKGPQVDHCHKTGAVRGILCVKCNTGLGHFADDSARLRSAVEYLERGQP